MKAPGKWALCVCSIGCCALAQETAALRTPFLEARPAVSPAPTYAPVTAEERWDQFFNRNFGVGPVAQRFVMAGFKTFRDRPSEWDQGVDGFSRRAGVRFLRGGVNSSVQLGMGFLLKDDNRYYPSAARGFMPRLGHAVKSSFLARNGNGNWVPAYSRFAGTVAGNVAMIPALPPSETSARHTLARSGIGIGGEVLSRVCREFSPEIKRLFKRK